MRKVYIDAKVRLVLEIEEGVSVGDAMGEIDPSIGEKHFGEVVDWEFVNYTITDSK